MSHASFVRILNFAAFVTAVMASMIVYLRGSWGAIIAMVVWACAQDFRSGLREQSRSSR